MKAKFNREKLYEILRMNGINSVRELCTFNDSLCYGGEFVSRKTIERACQTGNVSVRTLEILSGYFDCTPEFFTAPDVVAKEDNLDQCVVYMSDNREVMVKGKHLYWACEKDDNGRYQYKFYADCPDNEDHYSTVYSKQCYVVAEFCAAVCYGIVRVEV